MVKVIDFLANVQHIADENPRYDKGGDGRGGRCDCIGLIIGALRRCGYRWDGLHGSNWAARKEMRMAFDILDESSLLQGMIVFKYHDPFEAGYGLPARYQNGSDLRDYYHAGVVMEAHPLKILHCTSWSGGSIKIDMKLGQWRFAGWLKGIENNDNDKEEKKIVERKGIVEAATGGTVRMRAMPDRASLVLINVPVNSLVDVLEERGDWFRISFKGKFGWMIKEYIRFRVVSPEDIPEQSQPSAQDTVTLRLARDAAEYLLEVLKGGLNVE